LKMLFRLSTQSCVPSVEVVVHALLHAAYRVLRFPKDRAFDWPSQDDSTDAFT
jgi:hypothetical protein